MLHQLPVIQVHQNLCGASTQILENLQKFPSQQYLCLCCGGNITKWNKIYIYVFPR